MTKNFNWDIGNNSDQSIFYDDLIMWWENEDKRIVLM